MALDENDRSTLDRIKANPKGEFGAAGKVNALLRFGQPDHAERQEIDTLLVQIRGAGNG